MRIISELFVATAFLLATPSFAQAATEPSSPDEKAPNQQERLLDEGIGLIRTGKPAEAIQRFDQVNAHFEKLYSGGKPRVYCAGSQTEVILYMGEAAARREEAVALDRTWCNAIFLKGFALIDLGRRDEARILLERAIELAPMNSQYLAEYGEYKKTDQDWQGALDLFERAASAAELADDRNKTALQGRAWRGQGFALIELGRLDEAEAFFQRCLKLDPDDAKAAGELQYIKDQRKKKKRGV